MIVKDGGADLERCLRSSAPFVDRIAVGDTGSTDGSRDVARRCGAEVIDIPWEGDFSKARNRLIAQSSCDWLLILDADEMLDPAGGERIRQLTGSEDIHAYHNPRWNYVTDAIERMGCQAARKNPYRLEESRLYPAYVPLPTTRLFRNHCGIFFDGCVHETLAHRLASLNLRTARADFVVHHFGHVHDSEQIRRDKDELYHKLGEKKLEADPTDVQALMELGLSELEHRKDPRAALHYFNLARRLRPDLAAAWLHSGVCLSRLQRPADALRYLERAAAYGLTTGVLYQAIGDAHFQAGHFKEAHAAYTQVAGRGEASPLSEAKRGACEVHLGQKQAGLSRMQEAIRSAPHSAELLDILAAGALLSGDSGLAIRTMQSRIAMGSLTQFHTQFVAILEETVSAGGETKPQAAC